MAVVRRMLARWNDRDLEGMRALADPDIVYVNAPNAVEPGVRRGLDALDAVLRAQWEGLPEGRVDPAELEADADRVFVVVAISVSYGGSPPVAQQFGAIYTVRQGRIVRIEAFDDVESGRRAFGR